MRSPAPLLLLVFALSCTGTIDTTLVGAVCGDAIINGEEACDTGSESQTCDSDCTAPSCGDGRVNAKFTPPGASGPEDCDDGGTANGDGCSSTCQIETPAAIEPRCGDGIVGADELCDTSNDSATCDFDCTTPVCGDGHVNKSFTPPGATAAEHCDDGGTTDGDGCSALCQFESCGNGVTEGAEACDDGNDDDLDACRNDCTTHVCGDGIDSTAETCDSGGDSATCDRDCSQPACSDGIVNTAAGEECDDGGTAGGDGCSSLCQFESCGNGVTEGAEACDDGNEANDDACRNDCQAARCGDGIQRLAGPPPFEECDAGPSNTAGCDFDCTQPECNDGVVNTAAGEECDDGNNDGSDGCASCRFPFVTVLPNLAQWPATQVGMSGGLRAITVLNASSTETTGPIDVVFTNTSFHVEGSTDCGPPLGPSESCNLFLEFIPENPVAYSDYAHVGSDGLGGRASVFLQAIGTP